MIQGAGVRDPGLGLHDRVLSLVGIYRSYMDDVRHHRAMAVEQLVVPLNGPDSTNRNSQARYSRTPTARLTK